MRKEEYQKILDELNEKLKNYSGKEEIKRLLDFQTAFHCYSFRNTMLIFTQYPQATRVAGIKTWNKLGRWVKKGEKAIKVFAPCIKKIKKETESEDEVEEIEQITGFKLVNVFDVSQTYGKPLPSFETKKTEFNNHEEFYQRLLERSPIPVLVDDIMADGYYDTAKNMICLSKKLEGDNLPITLTHELAHYYSVDKIDQKYKNYKNEDLRQIKELVAEGAAYIVFKKYGLDIEPSLDYLCYWLNAGKDQNILGYGELIRETSRKIIRLLGYEKTEEEELKIA